MDYVSLLPPEIKQRRLEKRKEALLLKLVLVIFFVMMAVYAFLLAGTLLASSDLKTLRAEREDLEIQVAALEQYALLYNDMNRAEERLNMAMGSAPPWSDLLLNVSRAMPPGQIWLSELNLNYATESGTFIMRGYGYSHQNVADMLDRLNGLEQLDSILLRSSTETAFGGRDAVQFNVDAILLPGPPFLDHDGEDR